MHIKYCDYSNDVSKSERNNGFCCRSEVIFLRRMENILITFFNDANTLRHMAFPFQIISLCLHVLLSL